MDSKDDTCKADASVVENVIENDVSVLQNIVH
jgi:hypothetical protein